MSPSARRYPRLTASYMPVSFSTNALTRGSFGNQSNVPSSEQESWTMCSSWTPSWSATDGIHSFSHFELRKLGVIIENFTMVLLISGDGRGQGSRDVSADFELDGAWNRLRTDEHEVTASASA